MVLLTKSENKAPRATGRSSGKKRAADSLDACPILPKQARPENGEYGPSTTGHSSAFQLSTDPSGSPLSLGSRLLGSKEAPRAAGPVSAPEEGAERTKHRRKQKTPKKFTGEQPSISGTFGLKGLAKAEDKSRVHRAKKQEGPGPEDVRKKVLAPASTVSKEVPAPTAHPAPGGPEEQWQRAIHERGEAVCPTCNVVTRKTLVGLKKHMEVCQKVKLSWGPGGEMLRVSVSRPGRVCSCRTLSSVSTVGNSSNRRPASTITRWPNTAPSPLTLRPRRGVSRRSGSGCARC